MELILLKWLGNSLVVQWLGLSAFTAKGTGSIPGQGTKIPQATHQKKKWPYYPKQSTDSVQSLSKYQWHFAQNKHK